MQDNRDFEERVTAGEDAGLNDPYTLTGGQNQDDGRDSVYRLKDEEGLNSVYKLKDESQGGGRDELPDRETAERNSPYRLADEAREQWGEGYAKFYEAGEQASSAPNADDEIRPAQDDRHSTYRAAEVDLTGQPGYGSSGREVHGESGYLAAGQNRPGDSGWSNTERDMNNSPRFSDRESPEDTSTGYSAHEVNASSGYSGRNAGQPSLFSGHDVNVPVADSPDRDSGRSAHLGQQDIMPGGNTGRDLSGEQDTLVDQTQAQDAGVFQADGDQGNKENHLSETVTLNTDPIDTPSKLDNI